MIRQKFNKKLDIPYLNVIITKEKLTEKYIVKKIKKDLKKTQSLL